MPVLIGTAGWSVYVTTPWVQVDLRDEQRGTFIPWQRPEPPAPGEREDERCYTAQVQGSFRR